MFMNIISLVISITTVCLTMLVIFKAPHNDYTRDNTHEKDKLREVFDSYTIKE